MKTIAQTIAASAMCVFLFACTHATEPLVRSLATEGASQSVISSTAVPQVTGSWYVSCGVRSDRTLTCWGTNYYGQIPESEVSAVAQVSVGVYHTCALKTDASVSCWGYNPFGQTTVPAGLAPVTQISTAEGYTCALKIDATVQCWGDLVNYSGGVVPPGLNSVTQISSHYQHTCAVKADETVTCWGNNYLGQSNVPIGLNGVVQVSAGVYHTCALKSDGTVVCWGDSTAPAGLNSVIQLVSGHTHSCALKSDGTVVCWGFGPHGANVPDGLSDVSQLGAGYLHTCAVKTNGAVVCWEDEFLGFGVIVPEGLNLIADAPGATPTGSNIAVTPTDQTTGEPAPASITFSSVTTGGVTTVVSGEIGDAGAPSSPSTSQFRLGQPPTYFDVTTTAVFTGTITLCFDYSGTSYGNESLLKLLHFENSAWVDVTTSLDTVNNIICGNTTSLSPFIVAESNAAPVVTAVILPGAPVPTNTAVAISASFTDANVNDTHNATVNWESASSSGDVTEGAGSGTVNATRTYTVPGIYTVGVLVSDGGKSGSRTSALDIPAYLVVYDPSAGFVTGSGWFDSPAGSCQVTTCASDGSTVGKATFGFVSKYRKGATTPDGRAEFEFRAGALQFVSANFQWLVVSGNRAQFKGIGTINGAGDFGFLITALDGALGSPGSPDQFRIKIWDRITNVVVYDNRMGASEDSNAATPIVGGSIVIHR